jgi:mRNA-degrading endonuclease toxin of MazEF toxin-antitoxin module
MAKILPKTGDIVWIDLDSTQGGEKNKTRPCVVLVGSGHPWGLVIVVPITDAVGTRPPALFVSIPSDNATGLAKPSCVDCFQVRFLSEGRVRSKIGIVPDQVLADVRSRLATILDIGEEHVT